MLAAGYVGAVGMGITLGVMGGGGSILAVPILVGLFGVPGAAATYYSLFVVGLAAAVAVVPYARRGLVQARTALLFFLPSMLGVITSRRLILPSLPFTPAVRDQVVLVAFGIVMIAAAWSMIRKRAPRGRSTPLWTALSGYCVGGVTGFVGAGGGFLIVPSLVNALGFPMERAVGTSLLIIAMNASIGFGVDLASGMPVDWELVLPFSAAALAGILAGTRIARGISPARLKPAFGWFVLAVGLAMILNSLRRW